MEVFLVLGFLVALIFWFRLYKSLFHVHSFRPNKIHRTVLKILPIICVLVIAAVIWRWGSNDVRSSASWIFLYTMGGAAWLLLGLYLLSLLGVGLREDVLERQNPAAAWVVYGALTGTALCYTGANIGSGPGTEVVIFCAVLSTAFLFGFWFCLERIFRLADKVTIEREESIGIRVGGWMLSLGLIFGAAVAGDWESLEGTVWDFFGFAWVAVLFLLAAVAIESVFKLPQNQEKSRRGTSIAIAAAYILAAVFYVVWRGLP
jgi:uncharacterized membrane protein YjfL (UPF0719 family)